MYVSSDDPLVVTVSQTPVSSLYGSTSKARSSLPSFTYVGLIIISTVPGILHFPKDSRILSDYNNTPIYFWK